MSRSLLVCAAFLLTTVATALPVLAQRGVGDAVGIARQAVKPTVTQISGSLMEVQIGPCEATTGHAVLGAHLILQISEGQTANIHLGPANALQFVIDQLEVGQTISADVFRTEKLAADHYVAVRLNVGGTQFTLRDESLRPIWAGTGSNGFHTGGRGQGYRGGRGQGYGGGRGQGYGGGRGQGYRGGRSRGYGDLRANQLPAEAEL